MSFMFEVYYRPPRDPAREKRMTEQVVALGGRLDYWEDSNEWTGICLTFEFDARPQDERAAEILRQYGEHAEGVSDYGN